MRTALGFARRYQQAATAEEGLPTELRAPMPAPSLVAMGAEPPLTRTLTLSLTLLRLQALGSVSAAKQASLERRVEIAARNLAETPSQARAVG